MPRTKKHKKLPAAKEKELLALKKAVETMQLGVTITDTKGKILYVNSADANTHGYSVDELIGRDVRILAPNTLWKKRPAKSWVETKGWRRESLNVKKDGTFFPVHLMSDVVKNRYGEPIGIVTTCEDISERKRAGEQIQNQLKMLMTLREIDMAILSSFDLRLVLNVLLDHLIEHLRIHAALVTLMNPHTQVLEYAESRGFRSPEIRGIKLRLNEGLSGQVAFERRLISVPDLTKHEAAVVNRSFIEQENIVSYFGLPLIAKGNLKGTLELFHRDSLTPEPEWIDFLEALGAQAAIAIDNATMLSDLERSNTDITLAYDTTLDGWSRALDLRDRETEGHSKRVAEMTLRIGQELGMDDHELLHVRKGALLHDIGKMGIPDSILLKPGPLTDDERMMMQKHTAYAFEMLSPIKYLRQSIDIPYCHHEKWDGSGYPRGLKGEEIPFAARIFTIVDVWDALLSARPYRQAFSREWALEYLRSREGKDFDPKILKVFLSLLEKNVF